MNNFEIEIKTLLGNKEQADILINKMKASDANLVAHGMHTQLNHYFIAGDMMLLKEKLTSHLPLDRQEEFIKLVDKTKDYSMRSRSADGKIIFVLKVAIDDTSSSNGTARREFECDMNMTLEELDKILLSCNFKYQAKWSRERQAFDYKGLAVTIDKNAGYGYLAEFESVVDDPTEVEEIKDNLRKIMFELGVDELKQDRLARMFDFYNTHWEEYYGSDKTFTIE